MDKIQGSRGGGAGLDTGKRKGEAMALKHCIMAEMVSLRRPWNTLGHPDRAALSRVATVEALIPDLDSAHADLLSKRLLGHGGAPDALCRAQPRSARSITSTARSSAPSTTSSRDAFL